MNQVIRGDCLEVMRGLPDNSVDAVVTDPPYGLSQHSTAEVQACLLAWCQGKPYKPKGTGFKTFGIHAFEPILSYNNTTGRCYQHPRHGTPSTSRNAMNILSDDLPSSSACVKECAICHTQFKVKPSHFERRKTCSKPCLDALKKQARVVRQCKNCGKEMIVQPSRARHGRGFVCSKKCQYDRNKEVLVSKSSVLFQCLCCGIDFKLAPSTVASKKGAGKYCSRECRDIHRKKEGHPMYMNGRASQKRGTNWQAQKRKAKQRDSFTCQCCGITEQQSIESIGQALHVHHKTPYRMFDDYIAANQLSNLMTLCPSCHRKADAKTRQDELNNTQAGA